MVCLDTTFLADWIRSKPEAVLKLREFRGGGERVVTTIINLVELYEGAWAHSRAPEKVDEMEGALQGLVVLDLNLAAAREFGRLKAGLQRRGQSVGDWDLLVAAIALAYGESRIVTRNVRDFKRIPGIEVITY